MKKYKNAFTLVELLAVIVILAIILVIAVPKVMSIIEDSKKATLENTVKMIASSAEKAKIQNAILGNNDVITCESIANINNVDYANCEITFDNDIAKVTIKGSGKFAGLNVCNGTRTNATSISEICPIGYGIGTTYISKLLEEESILNNGLFVDNTEDQNIRYRGSKPNNKVYFNCKDTDSAGVSYGETNYNYASSCELWRIIGVFDTYSDEVDTIGAKRIKIVKDDYLLAASWDSSGSDVNSGHGVNQWGDVKDSDGNIIYEGADLMRMLNGYYIGKEDTCIYCNGYNQDICPSYNNCASSVAQLSNVSLSFIEDVLWHTGTVIPYQAMELLNTYVLERGDKIGRICTSSDGDNCSDLVTRTTSWIGKVGLIYPSDYAYASADKSCSVDIYGNDSTCGNNNWLHPIEGNYWTMSPYQDRWGAHLVWEIHSSNHVYSSSVGVRFNVRPTTFLKSNIQIIGGNGDNEPYKLK